MALQGLHQGERLHGVQDGRILPSSRWGGSFEVLKEITHIPITSIVATTLNGRYAY